MVLCHDDILLPNFSNYIARLLPELRENTTVNPARSFFKDVFDENHLLFTDYGLLAYPNGIGREDFISRDLDRFFITNVSGIIINVKDAKEARKAQRLLLYGMRAEHFLLCSKSIETIYGTTEPLIGIRVHNKSQGALVKKHQTIIDQSIYFAYIYLTVNDKLLKNKILELVLKLFLRKFLSLESQQRLKGYIKRWLK
jgi:hypothetical protein